jgi:hypothetical protein
MCVKYSSDIFRAFPISYPVHGTGNLYICHDLLELR